jgi:3-hydroxybutyryl-CoA dehydrogenase
MEETTGVALPAVRAAIVGPGLMGAGIAQVFAAAGIDVTLVGRSEASARRAAEFVATRLARTAAAGAVAASGDLGSAAGAQVVVEAILEDLDAKRSVFASLAGLVAPDTILATNTSSLSVSEIAAGVPHPDRLLGMHFMNPAPVMKLVEIVRGEATSDRTVSRAEALALRLGKKAIVVADRPCFVVNRLLMPLINEAGRALDEGVASAEDIDAAMKLGANFPMGPLHLADLIGLDIVVGELRALEAHVGPRHAPCRALTERVERGEFGRKSGQGFFTYATS